MKPGVRIAAGDLKGRRLKIPPAVRPTSQRVREAIFSHWQDRIVDSAFLDLFAGSGAVGLEAASRGARRVLSVEGRPAVARGLKTAMRELAGDTVEVRVAELPNKLRTADSELFDLVFADPPYDFEAYEPLLLLIDRLVTPEGEAAVEHSIRAELPERAGSLECVGVRTYGESRVSYYRRGGVR
jgi:16S rRNA (guanine(966)-N(2))-methyltransferase RsmD